MAGYFQRDTPAAPSLGGWLITQRWYANSAAKFWTGILDELATGYAEAERLELAACIPGPLAQDLLDPRASLQRMADSYAGSDLAIEIRRAARDLELLGPPGSVTYRIMGANDALIEAATIPHVDAEIFAHLVVWLPEWAGIDPQEWNDQTLTATVTARRPERSGDQTVTFTLCHAPLHEGLYQCRVAVHLSSSHVAEEAMPA